MKISSLELTMFDLLRYPHAGGGLSNVVTVLSEPSGRVDPNKLAALVPAFERLSEPLDDEELAQLDEFLLSRIDAEVSDKIAAAGGTPSARRR